MKVFAKIAACSAALSYAVLVKDEKKKSKPEDQPKDWVPSPQTEAGSLMQSPNMVTLTDANFDTEVANKNSFVMFGTGWCGHCKRLKPIVEKVADKTKHPSHQVAFVDCSAHDATCSKHEISGYPTMKYFNENTGTKGAEYEGDNSEVAMIQFIEANQKKTPKTV